MHWKALNVTKTAKCHSVQNLNIPAGNSSRLHLFEMTSVKKNTKHERGQVVP